jgi:YggT family protein
MIRFIIDIYILVLIGDAILSYIPSLQFHPLRKQVKRAADLSEAPVRKLLPPDLPFDPSPIIVIIILNIIKALW